MDGLKIYSTLKIKEKNMCEVFKFLKTYCQEKRNYGKI